MDWDGTCVTNEWPAQSTTWMPGCVDALHELSKYATIIIHTSRIAPFYPDLVSRRSIGDIELEVLYIREMLDDAGLTMVDIHREPFKPGAVAYVDDKAVHYTGRPGAWKALTHKLAAMAGKEEEL